MKLQTGLLLSFFSLLCVEANAQMINGSASAVVQHPKPVISEPKAPLPREAKPTEERVKAIIAEIEDEPPSQMTPEQKNEIDTKARKDLKVGVKYQSIRERKDVVDVLNVAERNHLRRQALGDGKTPEEADKVAAEIEEPDFNPAQTDAMEKYVFEKTNLIEQPKVKTVDVIVKQ